MHYRSMLRATVLLAIAVTLAACADDPSAPGASLSITSPQDGATFAASDDIDPTAAGLQIELAMLVTNLDEEGSLLITREGPTPRQTELDLDGTERAATVTTEVTLLSGSNTIRVELLDADDETVAESSVTISADTSGLSEPPSIAIVAPTDGQTLTSADDLDADTDDLQVQVVVNTENVTDGRGITVSGTGIDAITAQVDSGVATFDLTLPEGTIDITAAVTVGGETFLDQVTVTVQLDDEPDTCTVEIFPPLVDSPCQFSSQSTDADPDTDGFQVAFSADTTCATVELFLDGDSLGTVTTVGGTAEFDPVTIPEDVFTIEAVATDPVASEGSASQVYNADFTGPVATFDDTTLGARLPGDDTDPDTDGLQTTITGTFSDDDAADVTLTVDGDTVDNQFFDDGPGFVFDPVTFETTGTYTIGVSATDVCGNPADGDEQTIQVFLEEPDISITDPSTGDLLNASMDADTDTDGFQVAFTVSGALAPGTTVAIECSAAGEDDFSEIGTAEVDDDGRATVVADFEDGNADCRPTAAEPLALVGPAVSFGVDAAVPELTLTSPVEGESYGSIDVQVTATIDNIGDDEILTAAWNGTDIPGDELTITDGAIDEAITVAEGENTIRVSVTDAAGNEDSVEVTFTVDATAPTIEITSLVEGAALIVADDEDTDTAGFQHTLTLASDAEDGTEATVLITDESGPGTPFPVEITGGVGAAPVILPEGTVSVEATIRDELDNVSSDTVNVTVDSIAPTGSFVVPAAGEVFLVEPADDADPEASGLQFTVEINVSDIEDGQPLVLESSTAGVLADVTIDDPSSTQEITFTVTEPGLQELGATLTDASGNETIVLGGSIDVSIDGCGLSFVDFAGDPVYFNVAGDADADPSNGFDTDIAVEVASGACDGVEATLLVDGASAGTATIAGNELVFTGLNFADGTTGTIQAEATFPGGDTPAQTELLNFIVDVTAPTIDNVTPGADGAETPIGIADAGTGGVGFIDLSVFVTDGNGADYEVSDDGGVVATGTISGTSFTLNGFAIDEGNITLTITVSDAADNTATVTRDYLVDFSAPGAVTFTLEQINRRSGETRVAWTGDDTVATYEIRTSLTEITDVTWGDLDGDPNNIIVPSTPGALEHVYDFLEPFQMTHYIGMRATDPVGNVGPVTGDEVFVGLLEERIALATPYASLLSAGDIDGDGNGDLLALGFTPGFASAAAVVRVTVAPSGDSFEAINEGTFGTTPFMAATGVSVGDVDGDTFDDIFLTDSSADLGLLVFGSASGLSSRTIEFTLDIPGTGLLGFAQVSGSGDVVTLPTETRAYDDIVVSARDANGNGTVWIIAGRSGSDWPAAITFGSDATVDYSLGIGTILAQRSNPDFGIRVVSGSDLDGDGLQDLGVSSFGPGEIRGTVHVYRGRELSCISEPADCEFPPAGLVASDRASTCPVGAVCEDLLLTGSNTTSRWSDYGFAGGRDVDGDGLDDLAVADRTDDELDLLMGRSPIASASTMSIPIGATPLAFGQSLRFVSDLKRREDAEVAEYTDLAALVDPSLATAGDSEARLFMNDGTGLFSFGDSFVLDDNSPSAISGAIDLNGDSLADFVILSESGSVLSIWY